MNVFIFIPAFLVFTYYLYKLAKDDYVFIRKNISSEQIFDIAFVIIWISLFFSRLLYFITHSIPNSNIFLSFFSWQTTDLSLLGFIIGGAGGLYFIGKYNKLPIERLFNIFVAAFIVALPVGFFSTLFYLKEYELLLYFFNGVIYSIFAFYFIKYLSYKPTIFLLFFSAVSLANSLLMQIFKKSSLITIENILLLLLTVIGLVLFLKRK